MWGEVPPTGPLEKLCGIQVVLSNSWIPMCSRGHLVMSPNTARGVPPVIIHFQMVFVFYKPSSDFWDPHDYGNPYWWINMIELHIFES